MCTSCERVQLFLVLIDPQTTLPAWRFCSPWISDDSAPPSDWFLAPWILPYVCHLYVNKPVLHVAKDFTNCKVHKAGAELDVCPIFLTRPNPTHKWSDPTTWPDPKLTWNSGPDLVRPILHDFQLSTILHHDEHHMSIVSCQLCQLTQLTTDTAPVKRLYCCVTHFHFPAAFCCGCNLEVYRL